jgi:photosystem II stability/assembly factor-like uncharacterized protein
MTRRAVISSAVFTPLIALAVSLSGKALAAGPDPYSPQLVDALVARPLGPANMGGRIVAVAVLESQPSLMYVASASGGLWKTINNGTTWTPLFDHQSTVSIGDVAVAPSNPDVVWVGTGEANARNSVSWGDGVYQSTNGGRSWRHMGLKGTAHIGRIVIHPRDPNLVYVAALGRLWGSNTQRGVYKTTDGGRTWRLAAYIDADTGFIDLAMDPADPDTLYAAAYRCRRDEFSGGNPKIQFGPGAGLYKSTDAGQTWVRMRLGLQERNLGRCGIAVYRRDPRILYAVIQTDQTDIRTIPGQAGKTGDSRATGGVFRSEDRGQSWTKVNDLCPRPFYYGQIRIDPNDDRRIYVLGISLHVSSDGGRTFRSDGAAAVHSDHHALWIGPHNSDHLVLGGDGGLNFSYDRGVTWEHLQNLPIGQFYGVAVDLRKPYRIYGGLQDNGSWGGPSATRNAEGITPADWFRVLGMDGFACQVDPTDPDLVYAEGQYGLLQRVNVRTGVVRAIRPRPPRNAPAYRFNWNAPMLVSPHRPAALYYGGNHLFRSFNRGDSWEVISPDLTQGKPGPSPDTGHTLTTIAESPLKPGLLYVGTDDGRVHVCHNSGATWTDLSDKIPGIPAARWITRIECSHFAAGTAYLALDCHRQDDRRPYVFQTTDYGQTWQARAGTLPPHGPVHVLREDLRNPGLLFAGTEFGFFLSLNGGTNWHPLSNGLPTVAVHDLVIHPRDRELVIATHGRGLYILDTAPLEELTPDVLARESYLCDIKPATAFQYRGARGKHGDKSYAAPNPPYGAVIYYYLRDAQAEPVSLTISDARGPISDLKGAAEAGLHRVVWTLNRTRPDEKAASAGRGVPPGEYQVKLRAGAQVLVKKVQVEAEEPAPDERRAARVLP